VTYASFKKFVLAREAGLKAAFELFDRDRDGRISSADLDASLAHVTICCPNTRCVVRAPPASSNHQQSPAAGCLLLPACWHCIAQAPAPQHSHSSGRRLRVQQAATPPPPPPGVARSTARAATWCTT
jgi:hypothetical protein